MNIAAVWILSGVLSVSAQDLCTVPGYDEYSDLALDYFITKRVHNVIMFICWPIQEKVRLLKKFSESGLSVSLPDGRHKKERKDVDNLFRSIGNPMGAIFDSRCYSTNPPFSQKYTYFNNTYKWLVLNACIPFNSTIMYLQSLPITIVSDIVVTKSSVQDNNSVIELYDIYNPGFDRGGTINVTYLGIWQNNYANESSSWKNFIKISKSIRRSNLNGLVIRTVTFNEYNENKTDLHTYLIDDHYPYYDSVFKMNYQLVLLLKDLYNFTIKLILAENWSDKNVNGLYRSGNLLGVLANKKADIMGGALQLMEDRVELVDVIHMTYPFRCGFVFRYSDNFGSVKPTFLAPFVSDVWYLFLCLSLLVIVIIWAILGFENKYLSQVNKITWKFSDTFLSVWGAWCQMGSDVHPTTSASRFVYFTLFLNSLIMYNFYTSSIVSSLLSYRFQKFTIPQLADSPMECGSVDIGYVHNLLFDTPSYPNMEYFNSKKKTDHFYFTIDEGVRKVREGGFAYHAEYSSYYDEIENTFGPTEICELQEVDTIPMTHLGIMGLKYSPYSEMFRVGMVRARETGQIFRLLNKWVSRKPICQTNKGITEVNIHQITSFYVLLLMGHCLSIIIVVYERRKVKDDHKLRTKVYKNKWKKIKILQQMKIYQKQI